MPGQDNHAAKTFMFSMHCFYFLPSVAEVSAESELSQVVSSHTVSSSHWEAEVGDGDMDIDEDLELPKDAVNPSNLCQQFNSELKKKFQVGHIYSQQGKRIRCGTDTLHYVVALCLKLFEKALNHH